MAEERVDIRIRLEGKVRDRFLEIKKVKGLKTNTEVIRALITEYYNQIKEDRALA